MVEQHQTQIIKSKGDSNVYKYFTLANGVEVVLIQDNNQKELEKGNNMAYCAFAMNVGSYNEMEGRYGLAHFLEHMIFMGSEKYPEENVFSDYISAHGGYCNAFTEFEFTNYQFRVDYKGLKQALDMQAWLFQAPLLRPEAMEREIKSVESEFQGNFPYDSSRLQQIMCENTASRDHIFNCFSWGNIKSLKESVPKEAKKEEEANSEDKNIDMSLWNDLKAFYDSTYSADRLKVVIQVKTEDDLAELTQWVTESFGVIKNKKLGAQDFSKISKRALSEDQKQKIASKLPFEGNENEMILVNHIMDNNSLVIVWQHPFNYERWQKQSAYHVDELVGTEGPGSLYQILKELNWIDSLSTMDSSSYKSAFKFQFLEVGLTDEGLLHAKEVLAIINGMLDKLRNEWLPNRESNSFH